VIGSAGNIKYTEGIQDIISPSLSLSVSVCVKERERKRERKVRENTNRMI
jgi:hypothetical protein